MVVEEANIVSHMGDYLSSTHSEPESLKERKEKGGGCAGETLIDMCASETEETACCALTQKQPKPKIGNAKQAGKEISGQ